MRHKYYELSNISLVKFLTVSLSSHAYNSNFERGRIVAKVTVEKIKPKPVATAVPRETSHMRQSARKIGLDIPKPKLSLPEVEPEEPDIG